jgi:uncharacterized protein
MIPNKEQAIDLLFKNIKEKQNIDHCFLVGYGLQGLAKHFKEDLLTQEYWFVVGLLHDLDLEKYDGDISKHTLITEKILQEKGIDQQLIEDIKSHNDTVTKNRSGKLQHALYSLDGLTGIIRAYVLMRPDKDLLKTETKSILKKIKDKYFAAAVSREQIYLCEKDLGLSLNDFVEICLKEIKENYKI